MALPTTPIRTENREVDISPNSMTTPDMFVCKWSVIFVEYSTRIDAIENMCASLKAVVVRKWRTHELNDIGVAV